MARSALHSPPWPALTLGMVTCLAGLVALTMTGLASRSVFTAAGGYAVGAAFVAAGWRLRRFGAANLVTLARMVGTTWVAGLLVDAIAGDWLPRRQWTAVAVCLGCLLLDGVDGRVARARRAASEFGARFDNETDAALTLVVSLLVAVLGVVGWWVLAIGVMRYAYLAASARWSWLRAPLPPSLLRKALGLTQAIALQIALASPLVPVVPRWLPAAVLTLALAGLCWSFGRDVGGQWQRRGSRR